MRMRGVRSRHRARGSKIGWWFVAWTSGRSGGEGGGGLREKGREVERGGGKEKRKEMVVGGKGEERESKVRTQEERGPCFLCFLHSPLTHSNRKLEIGASNVQRRKAHGEIEQER